MYKNNLKSQRQRQWQQLVPAAAHVADWPSRYTEVCEKLTWPADVMCSPWISHFIMTSLPPSLLPLHFPAITCQSSSVGDFLTALSLSFILLMKFGFFYTEFIFPLVFSGWKGKRECRLTCRLHFHAPKHPASGKRTVASVGRFLWHTKWLNPHGGSRVSLKLDHNEGKHGSLGDAGEVRKEQGAEVERRRGLQGRMVVR